MFNRLLAAISVVLALAAVMTADASAATPSPPFTQCPAVGADASCALLIYITPSGSVGVLGDPSRGPFDSIEDTLIGVQNDSHVSIASIPIAATSGKALFGFDSDGLCTFGIAGCPFGPTGYEGPGVSFTGISADLTSGTVNFAPGIPPSGHVYFSLEEALATVPPFDIAPGPPVPSDPPYVALGDSYSAGEGLGSYESGTDIATNHCHRSSIAYSHGIAAHRNLTPLTFAACSGAITADFVTPNHEGNLGSDGTPEPAQVLSLRKGTQDVTFTIGGNDIGFSDIVKSCLIGRVSVKKVFGASGCKSKIDPVVQQRLSALGGQGTATTPRGVFIEPVLTVLEDIHGMAPTARIYLAGYPLLFGQFKGECGVGSGDFGSSLQIAAAKITAGDADYLNALGTQLNDVLSHAASLARGEGIPVTFVNVSPYFDGHRLCDAGNSWIKPAFVSFDPSAPTPVMVDPGSFHPTVEGALLGYEAAFLDTDIGQ